VGNAKRGKFSRVDEPEVMAAVAKVINSANQPEHPAKRKAQRMLFGNDPETGEREGQKEGEGKWRQTGRKAEGGSDIDTENSVVKTKLLHQVLFRTPHGRGLQKGSNVSARLPATSKPYSRSQAYGAQMNATTVKEQEFKQHGQSSTRSKQLVQVAQSQMPCQSQTPVLFGEARSQPVVHKHAQPAHDAAGFRSGYDVTKVSEVYGNF
jgi:hypothetical protein